MRGNKAIPKPDDFKLRHGYLSTAHLTSAGVETIFLSTLLDEGRLLEAFCKAEQGSDGRGPTRSRQAAVQAVRDPARKTARHRVSGSVF
jgi:hypothetical protein